MAGFHRIGLMPEFGKDFSRIYPPLLPLCIAALSVVTGENYYSAHAAEVATLLLAIVAAFVLARILSGSALSALFSGTAVAAFLIPRNATMVLTEPLHTAALLGCLAALITSLRDAGGHMRAWAWVGAVAAAAATLSRLIGALLIPSLAVAIIFTQPLAELRRRRYSLTVIGSGWLGGLILYWAYESYIRALGGIPLHTLLHGYTALLEGTPRAWPLHVNQQSGVVTAAPEAYSLWRMFLDDPAGYLRVSWVAFEFVASQWFILLLVVHALRVVYGLARRREWRIPWLVCDISLISLFVLSTMLLCLLGQHPIFISRMYQPWIGCSLVVLCADLGRRFALPSHARPGIWLVLAILVLAAAASQYSNIHSAIVASASKYLGGEIAGNVVEGLRRSVPRGQTVIGSPVGGPDIAITIAGYPNMYFSGPPVSFRSQMRAHGIQYALIAPGVTPDANAAMSDCSVVFDYPFNRLFSCAR